MKTREKHLYYLEELKDYEVDSHYNDVRGWPVKDLDNRVIGKVDNLLVNKNLEKVVYLDVEVDHTIIEAKHDPYGSPANEDVREFVNKEGENHIIIPIGLITINEKQKFVYSENIDHRTFAETKRIKTGTNINREYETVVMDSYNRKRNQEISDNRFDADKEYTKESAYRADRDKREEVDYEPGVDENMDRTVEDWRNERKNLQEERRKLRHERLRLEEERKKLETERSRKNDTLERKEWNYDSNIDENRESANYDDDEDSFYDRNEFDGENYRER